MGGEGGKGGKAEANTPSPEVSKPGCLLLGLRTARGEVTWGLLWRDPGHETDPIQPRDPVVQTSGQGGLPGGGPTRVS